MVSILRAWTLGAKSFLSDSPGSVLVRPGDIDLSKVGDGTFNSAVEACLSRLSSAVAEPPIGVVAEDDSLDLDGPAAKIFARPTPWLRGSLLTRHIIVAMNVAEHAILWKAKNLIGQVVQLIPLPPTSVKAADGNDELATPEERAEFEAGIGKTITHFIYSANFSATRRLEVEDVIYLRLDIDPKDMKRGRSKLSTALKEVLTDDEAALFSAALLANMGVPGVVMVPDLQPGDKPPTEDQANEAADVFYERFRGSKRGRPLMMAGRWTPHIMSFNPEQMNFEALRRIPEERISAVIGVPAILAGLGAGLDAATYSNARELREFFTEETVVPLWKMLAEEYTYQLGIPDFHIGEYRYDVGKVAALQEDLADLWKRWQNAVTSGLVTVAEFRAAVGLEVNAGDDVYLRPPTLLELAAVAEPVEPAAVEPV